MTAQDTRNTQISSDPTVPLIRIVREFDAPPHQVFRAHTDPELLVQWLGPAAVPTEIDYFDCRRGGAFRYVMTSGDQLHGFHGSFHDVIPDEEIVQTFTWEGMPEHVALERVRFEDIGGGRTRLTATSLVDSFEDRDAWLTNGMEQGVVEGYKALDELLTR
jgi:uncharacterized protein YndB with AHSA1/START domain